MIRFTFDYIKKEFESVIEQGYKVIRCEDYPAYKKQPNGKVVVNRIDIDFSVKKTEKLIDIFDSLNIKGSFFLRLHAPEYNPFSFESYRILKKLINSGHELGYHAEIVDQSHIWNENAETCLLRDMAAINSFFGIQIKGVASHGGMTGYNNLDFWVDKKASDYNLLYEAYDKEPGFNLFQESFYVSDSEWVRWKCYDKGVLVNNDRRSLSEHCRDGHQVIYSLIHPDTYYSNHVYE